MWLPLILLMPSARWVGGEASCQIGVSDAELSVSPIVQTQHTESNA